MPGMESTFPNGYVVLWRPTDQHVIQSAGILELQIKLEDPCDQIKEGLNMSQLTKNTFYNWCLNEVKRDVLLPMEALCIQGSNNRMTRGFSATIATVSFGILIGIAALQFVANTRHTVSSKEILEKIGGVEMTIAELQEKYNTAVKEVKKLTDETRTLATEALPTLLSASRLKDKMMKMRFQLPRNNRSLESQTSQ